MDDPVATFLKFGFLLVLFLFLAWVAWSARRDLAGYDEASLVPEGGPVEGDGQPVLGEGPGVVGRLEVIAAMGYEPGTYFEIAGEAMMGRAPTSDIPIQDAFASSAHARIFPRGQFMYIEDMGSTNGTFLNGHQLVRPEQLKPADTIRIGDSEYRYQE